MEGETPNRFESADAMNDAKNADGLPSESEGNFASFVFSSNRARSAKTAYVDDRDSITYGALEDRAKRFASLLGALGVSAEEPVIRVNLHTIGLPVAFHGALYAGVVPVVTNTMVPASDLAYFIAHSNARVVFASSELATTARSAIATNERSHDVRVVISGGDGIGTESELAVRLDASPLAGSAAPTYGDDIAFWLYSSGSTGKPKAVVHTHANLLHTVNLYGKPIMGITDADTIFSAAKLFFAYGLGNALTFPLAVGAKVILMAGRATPDAIFERLVAHSPTIFCGAPTTYVAMLASPSIPPRERVSLRVCVSAGEALPEDIGKRFENHFGAPILDGIGSTEMLHIFLSNRLGEVRYGTSGRPCEGYELELRDGEAGLALPGEIGDLWVKGPSTALMYWRDRERSRATFFGPWMKTGDKYRMLPVRPLRVCRSLGRHAQGRAGSTFRQPRSRRRSSLTLPCSSAAWSESPTRTVSPKHGPMSSSVWETRRATR